MSFSRVKSLVLQHQRKTSDPEAAASGELPTIVIVDDDASMLESLREAFRGKFRPVTCTSGREALDKVDLNTAAVVLDIRMPGMDGFQVCKELQQRLPCTPVLFHSAHQGDKDALQIINEHRPFAFIAKEGDLNKIVDAVSRAVAFYACIKQTYAAADRVSDNLKRSLSADRPKRPERI